MPLRLYLETTQGRRPVTLPTHFNLQDFRDLIQKKVGNPEHFNYSLGGVIFRTWNEDVFNRQRSAIRDGVALIIEYSPVINDGNGPAWRHAQPGLCLDGVCLNGKCSAFENKVIINQGLGQFTIINNSTIVTSQCPLCGMSVQPTTCAFNQCSWRIIGTKQQQQQSQETITTDWQNSIDEYHRWAENFSSWSQLTVETKK